MPLQQIQIIHNEFRSYHFIYENVIQRINIECNSYGELKASALVSSDYFDLTSSVYSIAASKERRVECYLKFDP